MSDAFTVGEIAEALRHSRGLAAKREIGVLAEGLGLAASAVPVGDDCAALPDGEGYSLFAMEGFINEFVAADPWFAGWCGVMVNISDIAAMGGRPTAIANALWAESGESAGPIIAGMRAASECYGVPIVGGHSNLSTRQSQLAVAILGKAKALLTSFDAKPGDRLIMAIDLRGAYREPFNNWQAALGPPAERLRGDLELLPLIAEQGWAKAAKDISQAGVVGTAAMLAECSGVGVTIDLDAIPKPEGVAMARWLQSFPSFGFLIAAPDAHVEDVLSAFSRRGVAVAVIGEIDNSSEVSIALKGERERIVNYRTEPVLRMGAGAAAKR